MPGVLLSVQNYIDSRLGTRAVYISLASLVHELLFTVKSLSDFRAIV